MNNMLSYCGLVDAKIRASDKDLPVWEIKAIGDKGRTKWAKYLKGSTANEEKALTDIQQRAVFASKTAKPKIYNIQCNNCE